MNRKRLIFFLSVITIVLSDQCFNEKLYYIQSATDGFTLNATNPVKIDYFAASVDQQWRFECADKPGYVYIIHHATGKALTPLSEASDGLILADPHSFLDDQQFVIHSTGAIVNVYLNQFLSVKYGIFIPGNVANLMPYNETLPLQFILVEKK